MEKLKILRKSLCLTQNQVAMNLGIVQQKYQQYESGKYQPDIETLIRIADYFGVTLDYLLGRTEEKTSTPTQTSDKPKFALVTAEKQNGGITLEDDEKALIITLRRSNKGKALIRSILLMLGEDRTIEEILKMA